MINIPKPSADKIQKLVEEKKKRMPSEHLAALEKLKENPEGAITKAYEIVSAKYAGIKILDINKADRNSIVMDIIEESIKAMAHYKTAVNTSILQHNAEGILKIISIRFPLLTIQELMIVMYNLIHGKYKKKDVLNAVSIVNVEHAIVMYKVDEEVRASVALFHKMLGINHNTKPVPSKEEQTKIVFEHTQLVYNQYLVNGEMPSNCSVYYKYLNTRHDIKWNETELEEIETAAVEIAVASVNEPKLSLKHIITTQIKNKEGISFKNECQKIALRKWFASQKQKGITDIINLK